jgi:hypothetical protein
MTEEQETSLFYITAQYVAEVQSGQQPCLSDYIARYPRYVDAIADFVAYYHAVEEAIPSAEVVPPAKGAMTTLFTTVTGQRLLPSQLAAELDLSIDIILLLEQRAIAPVTIPQVLYEQIAMLLQRPSTVVQEYLGSLDQRQSQSVLLKRKPQTKVAEESTDYAVSHVADKPSFRAVVETSLQLSAEQRNRWCSVLDGQNIRACHLSVKIDIRQDKEYQSFINGKDTNHERATD